MAAFHYYGHSCFLIEDGKYKVLADPFLTGNPAASISADEVECDYILVSHGHADHLGDAPKIAKRTGAIVIGIPEVLSVCEEREPGIRIHAMNIGGSITLPFGKVRMTEAIHSCGVPGGLSCGYVINIGNKNVYFAGDTSLFYDMKLIGKKDTLDYAVLPIGDNFTMGLEDAALAAQWLNASNVIPIHYDTWPVIKQDVKKNKEITEEMTRAEVHILKPGSVLELA